MGTSFLAAGTNRDDLFTLRVFDGVSDTPIHEFASIKPLFRDDTGFDFLSSDVYFYGVNVPETNLAPGSYLFSIVNDTATGVDDLWSWMDNGNALGDLYARSDDHEPWFNAVGIGDPAFTLFDNIIPEPASATLLAILLGCLTIRRCNGSG